MSGESKNNTPPPALAPGSIGVATSATTMTTSQQVTTAGMVPTVSSQAGQISSDTGVSIGGPSVGINSGGVVRVGKGWNSSVGFASTSGISRRSFVGGVSSSLGSGLGVAGYSGGAASGGVYPFGEAGAANEGVPRVGAAWLKLDISHKPPTMKGSFDLYAVQLRAFSTRLDCWSVVDGSYRNNIQVMNDTAARDNAAREAILYGVPAAEAEMICQEVTAEVMWNRFVDRQTKREYSNYIFARDEFVSNRFTLDKNMEQWLSQMETLRRWLYHFGKRISDKDYAKPLLGHVSRTHREVVRQFSKHYVVRDGVTVRPVPTSVMAESALDERVANEEETKPAHICSCGKQPQSESQKPKP
ncbi:hypothetical protein PC129_g8814 [Phytophthora cactorum]|uniref:Uncharacterized protein n=1 Tax=Phytophthora cactorum TaxID=29920 RepID=A0A329RQT0_9STRA|nr:hypothetical protein Pcac1_g1289 [Phytophthora cactorum]KAG2808837.1 hypothetical protein PC111_g16314 [Phytophthora cactorum]KAG2904235.1 hypothetical protein PC115_g15055 [Phytophthora cactorum]KAG2946281.1 hypothetical protein PC117_g7750 [Phytophthora cactorum]KAG3086994.1 hypothetical protein PC122_g9027 [Phytophthora cactorum]